MEPHLPFVGMDKERQRLSLAFTAGGPLLLLELLSPVLPVWMIKRAVHRHFARTISYLVYQNLSRLASQWEESLNGALRGVEKEAGQRLDELIDTVTRLVECGNNERAPQLRADLDRLEKARKVLAAEVGS